MQDKNVNGSMIHYAMEYGTWLGALLILKFLTVIVPGGFVTHFLFIAVMIAIPVVFFYLVRLYASKVPYSPYLFSQLWSFGILIALFGSMLSGIVEYACLQYVVPDFLPRMVASLKEALSALEVPQDGQRAQVLAGMKVYLANLEVPTAIEFVMQEIITCIFFGSLFSVLVSPIVATLKRKKELRDKNKIIEE